MGGDSPSGGARGAAGVPAGSGRAERRAARAWGVARVRSMDAARAWLAVGKKEEAGAAIALVMLGESFAPGAGMDTDIPAEAVAAFGTSNTWLQRGGTAGIAAGTMENMAARGRRAAKKQRAATAEGQRRTAALKAAARASRIAARSWERAAARAARAAAAGGAAAGGGPAE